MFPLSLNRENTDFHTYSRTSVCACVRTYVQMYGVVGIVIKLEFKRIHVDWNLT